MINAPNGSLNAIYDGIGMDKKFKTLMDDIEKSEDSFNVHDAYIIEIKATLGLFDQKAKREREMAK